jgi:hypothetical protein
MDYGLTPAEAEAALATLDARDKPFTVGEVLELRRMRLGLQRGV